MSNYQRILVHLQKPGCPPVLAKFTDCILDCLNISSNAGPVHCSLQQNKLILSLDKFYENNSQVLLTHPPFCPIHCMTDRQKDNLPRDILERGVDVGVVVILETSDRNILLTRRAKHMRTFPGIWVPPGGHIELGETLMEAGLRELKEETGLSVTSQTSHMLCMWESVFPYVLSMGHSKRHHIVVYINITVQEERRNLENHLDLDKREVDAAMWLDPVLAQLVGFDKVPEDCPEYLDATVIDDAGTMNTVKLPSVVMTNQAPDTGADVERISTGTRYAIKQWLEYHHMRARQIQCKEM